MVGRDEGSGDSGQDVPGLCGVSESAGVQQAGASVPWCFDLLLASGAWSPLGRPCGCLTAEAFTPAELHDSERGGGILARCEKNTSPRAVFHYRLVYWKPTLSDSGTEVVND
jgi:hypothetical protein